MRNEYSIVFTACSYDLVFISAFFGNAGSHFKAKNSNHGTNRLRTKWACRLSTIIDKAKKLVVGVQFRRQIQLTCN